MVAQHFEREDRYIVIKRKRLSEKQASALSGVMEREGITGCESVVVESGWPEYGAVWAMIEARVGDGGTTFVEASSSCPICGDSTPHYHGPMVANAHRQTVEQRNRERNRGQ